MSLLTQKNRDELDVLGFTVVKNVLHSSQLRVLNRRLSELCELEGEQAGHEFRREPGALRLANLVDKGTCFQELIAHPLMIESAQAVLGSAWKLGSLNFRSALPGQGHQPLHCDMGMLPDSSGFNVFNSIWLLDDFTPHNGSTRIVPGTHRSGLLPSHALPEPSATHKQEVRVYACAGDVILTNAHVWHGGTTNHTLQPRRSLHGFYVRADLPQQQYQKNLLSLATQQRLTPQLRKILALDDPHNDELCQVGSGKSGFMQ
jgi:hypothetical protein